MYGVLDAALFYLDIYVPGQPRISTSATGPGQSRMQSTQFDFVGSQGVITSYCSSYIIIVPVLVVLSRA